MDTKEIELIVKQVLSNIDLAQINEGTYKNQQHTGLSLEIMVCLIRWRMQLM